MEKVLVELMMNQLFYNMIYQLMWYCWWQHQKQWNFLEKTIPSATYHGCIEFLNLEMEQKYLGKSDA